MDKSRQDDRTNWKIVLVIFGAGVVASSHIGKLPPALPEIRQDFAAGLVMGGWFASIISAVGFALGLVAGGLADRIGQRTVILAGLLALTMGSILGVVSQSSSVMLAARFIESIGFTATTISGGAIVAHVAGSQDKKWAMGVWATYMPLGFAGMMMIAVLFLKYLDWRTLWVVSAAISGVWALLTFLSLRGIAGIGRDGSGQRASVLRNVYLAVSQPGGVLAALCFAFYTAQHISLMSWLPTYLREDYGAGLTLASMLPALVLLFNAGGNALAAWLMKWRLSVGLLLLLGAVGMALTEIGIFSLHLPDSIRLSLAFAFGIFGGFIPAAALAGATVFAPTPAQIGTMNGLMVMGSNTGQLFGPPALAAARLAEGSWEGVIGLLLALAAMGMILASLVLYFELRTASKSRSLPQNTD